MILLIRVSSLQKRRHGTLLPEFTKAKASELEVCYSETGRLLVKMFGQGKKTYLLYTKDKGTNKERLNPSIPKQIKTSFGPESRGFDC